jgi:hypothetical protein
MVPPDDRAKRLPTLSWTSVVDVDAADETANDAADAVADAPRADDAPTEPDAVLAPSPAAPLVSPTVPAAQTAAEVEAARPAPVTLEPMTLTLGGDPAPAGRTDPIVFEPMTIAPAPINPAPPADEPALRIRTFAPAPIVPVLADEVGTIRPASAADPLPEIREATPAETEVIEPELAELVDRSDGAATPTAPEGPVADASVAAYAPALPRVAQPDQERRAAPAHVEPSTVTPVAAPRAARRGSRRGLKIVVMLVVIGALVAAAVVFGRPLLFPGDWDATTEPYALAVERARGQEFAEPLELVSVPAAEVARRSIADVLGDDQGDTSSTWRAFGLATGEVGADGLAASLGPVAAAVYSTDDGQVYVADGASGDLSDASVTRAMAAAALDQDHVWSARQTERTLDGATMTAATVARQARDIQTASTYDGAPDDSDLTALDALPSVVAYRLLAPSVFAEFDLDADPSVGNPLADLGTDGAGPLPTTPPDLAPQPAPIDGDVLVGEPTSMDRSFWFLAFASFLDGTTARTASEAIVDNAVVSAERGTDRCVYATFAGTGVDATSALRGALQQWAAAAPAELGATHSVLADGTMQLVTCDPGAAFATPVRPTAARELVAWRAAELATWEAILATDTADAAADVAFAWPFVAGSTVAADLVALDATTTPAAFADAARASVARTLTPSG